jgi:PIN domain nuclease of toxin-antitoxin system
VKLLLDTHAFLWWVLDDLRLSKRARGAIGDPKSDVFFSVASAWELAIKTTLGRLDLPGPLEALLPQQLALNGFHVLPVALSHALAVATLPPHHRDPFDRLLVAQAQIEELRLVSGDRQIARYEVGRIW